MKNPLETKKAGGGSTNMMGEGVTTNPGPAVRQVGGLAFPGQQVRC